MEPIELYLDTCNIIECSFRFKIVTHLKYACSIEKTLLQEFH